MPKAFIASDYILDTWLGPLGATLAYGGWTVVNGPKQKPPAKTVFDPADWPAFFGDTDIIVSTTRSILGPALLDAAPRLRGIVFPTIGTEAVDLADAATRGIAVAHGPTPENFQSMAESTVLLILALMYDLHGTERVLRENLPRPTRMRAQMVKGKTIGLVGLGRIARGVVQRLAGWDARLLAFDPYVTQDQAPAGVTMTGFDELLQTSDMVSLHTTLTPETRHLIGVRELGLMKPGAYLINTARGGSIDEPALIAALSSGRLAGAALDAFELEPLPADSPLRSLPNVILTPHMVGHSREIFDAIPPTALTNIERIMAGEAPLYWRNPEVETMWRARLRALKG